MDYHILRNQVEGTIFRIETLEEHLWNPLVYNVGGAIYYLVAREFAPLEERLRSVKERLRMVPEVVALAKANVKNPPRVHTETAIQQNAGTISLIANELQSLIDEAPEMKKDLKPLQDKAVAALTYYGSWLEKDLLPESTGEFRLGEEKFRKKLGYVLQSDLTMEDILRRAEEDLITTQEALFEAAVPLYREYSRTNASLPSDKKLVIRTVLDRLAESRPNNDTIVDRARECLEACTDFTV